jgi:hypothetical protein
VNRPKSGGHSLLAGIFFGLSNRPRRFFSGPPWWSAASPD